MPMRLTGLMSGMDTESIISQLVEARSKKVTDVKNAQTKLEWKQDIWKDLNKRLKTLQSKFLNNMRFTSGYTKKVTKASDSDAVSVITGDNAVNGVQELKIKQLAKTAYLTGGKVTKREEVTDEMRSKTMGQYTTFGTDTNGDEIPKDLQITIGSGADQRTVQFNITSDMTVSDVLAKFRENGIEAEFDPYNNNFKVDPSRYGGNLSISGGAVGLVQGGVVNWQVSKDELSALTKMSDLMTFETDANGNEIARNIKLLVGNEETNITIHSNSTISDVLSKMKEAGLNANFDAKQGRLFISARESGADGNFVFSTDSDSDALKALGLNVEKVLGPTGPTDSGRPGATLTLGQNAMIELNGADFESNNNTFEINGLILTAQKATGDTPVTLTTQQDTDGIYDMIKDFVKEYSEIINEIDRLYNAKAVKDFEPLTDDQKKDMSETEIEKYEQKIKDALLRKDDSLRDIGSVLKMAMSGTYQVNGETLSLANFGIETLGYFTSKENEKNAYHIFGNEDDEDTADKEDKLKALIASDPDKVISFFTQLTQEMYTKMNEQSKAVEGYRSYGSFYDDKKMKSDYEDYKTKVKDQEKKLADYEDKWYAKFAAMEKAMAKMQSNASAVTGLLGNNTQ